jgi:ribosomal protein L11 methyltransferase
VSDRPGGPVGWQATATVPAHLAEAVALAFEQDCESVSRFESASGAWVVSGFSRSRPDRARIEVALALAAAAASTLPPSLSLAPVEAANWVAASHLMMPPVRAGRFFIHTSTLDEPVPPGMIPIQIDAGMAFGSGHHGSTLGCLTLLARIRRRPRRPLDMGCGSGILAIAAARLWRVPVLAFDVDPKAVEVTRQNARLNGVGALVQAAVSDGYRATPVERAAPFDLIVSNILARPLAGMARPLARSLAPDGVAILAGFLEGDERRVLAAHQAQGLNLCLREVSDGWHAVMLSRSKGRA